MGFRSATLMMFAILLLTASCAPGEKAPEPDPPAPEAAPEATPEPSGSAMTAAAVLISHRVGDYETWKTAFDAHMPARREASCIGHYLKRGVDDPAMVYMYCLANDADRLRDFLGGSDLAEAMKSAGVEGEPTIDLLKPASRRLVPRQKLPGVIVKHRVEDYDAWRLVYDEIEAFRRQSGIVGDAVSRQIDDPDDLVIYHQAEDIDALRAFVDSPELQDAMQRAGVIGEPEIHFIQVVDFASY